MNALPVVALLGNPNVGKSTIFNSLTGLHQHTGNWQGKTLGQTKGICTQGKQSYTLLDLPGTYALNSAQGEEMLARDVLLQEDIDVVVVVCACHALERNLNLLLQTLMLCPRVVLCVNLMDEARAKGIRLDMVKLSALLQIPVVGTVGHKKSSLLPLLSAVEDCLSVPPRPLDIPCTEAIQNDLGALLPLVQEASQERLPALWLTLQLLDLDEHLLHSLQVVLGEAFWQYPQLQETISETKHKLARAGYSPLEELASAQNERASEIAEAVLKVHPKSDQLDRRLDRLLTGKRTAYPLMLALLAGVFWLTIAGANIPSGWIASALFAFQEQLTHWCGLLHVPAWVHGVLVLGVYRVLAWVVSVMLPPMAIFFPLFTLLEDVGYLPRLAYTLDHAFARCHACGKQALCMCMGFGCNAAGVVSCRIIDSPRERLLAILTNTFVPCNGRFPTLIALITIFFVGTQGGAFASLRAALLLTAVVLLGIAVTFFISFLLSHTLLKGTASTITLELPPYRKPQIGTVLVRSLLDRTLFVLGRAVLVAAPAGLVIYVLGNTQIGAVSTLTHITGFFAPFAQLLGLDGEILTAFLLGLPANEIVLPLILMMYLSEETILELDSLADMQALFLAHGWDEITALCVMLFSLLHFPCSTTLLSIRKETGSWYWTGVAFLLPTAVGVLACFAFASLARML